MMHFGLEGLKVMQVAMAARMRKSGMARAQGACARQLREHLGCTLERVLIGRVHRHGSNLSTDAALGAHYADGNASKRLDVKSEVFSPVVRTHASPLWAERITRAVVGIWACQDTQARGAFAFFQTERPLPMPRHQIAKAMCKVSVLFREVRCASMPRDPQLILLP
jgi:hypothetical protein